MHDYLSGRKVLVTGGTGSIGSEIVRQVLACGPEVVRVFSRDEAKQYFLESELGRRDDVRYLIGDIREKDRLRRALNEIDVVFHAAALKQVPSCEYNPFEAVKTNVVGTQNVIEASLEAGVSRVIAVSTDKAIGPASTMGATKLLSERLVATANSWTDEAVFACVRFGNVLNSRGSLVPLAKRQIERGGPVTITDERMTRFMMPISHAVELALEAGSIAKGGEIAILKMPALKIADLLRALVAEYAPHVGIDPESVRLHRIGVRPGEKLEERLVTDEELPRTEEMGRFLVVHPEHSGVAAAGGGEAAGAHIPESVYRSSKARFLDTGQIVSLLLDSGALERRAAEPASPAAAGAGRAAG